MLALWPLMKMKIVRCTVKPVLATTCIQRPPVYCVERQLEQIKGGRSTVTTIGASLCLIISFATFAHRLIGVWSLHYLIKGAQGGRAKTKAGHAKPRGGTAPRYDAFARALPPFSDQRPGSPALRL